MATVTGTIDKDRVRGATGADKRSRPNGTDTYMVDHGDDVVIEAFGEGTGGFTGGKSGDLISTIQDSPVLSRIAHLGLKTALRAKNLVLAPAARAGYCPPSLSDRGQDRWVIETFAGKRGGYFLELGAADGFSESNTYVLEKRYGWSGLCIEPNPVLFAQLKEWRSCRCVADAVDSEDGTVDYVLSGQESGIVAADTDNGSARRTGTLSALRAQGAVTTLRTKPLAAVLDEAKAPSTIDYLSFDVEGAETRILRRFPFDRYRFLSMTVERPTPELNVMLFGNGYFFVRNSLFDSFYIHASHPRFDLIKRETFQQIPAKAF